jgi:uncharacterized membrane protein
MRKGVVFMFRGYGFYNGGGMMGGGWLGMLFVGVLWVLAIAAVVVLVVMLTRRAKGHGHMYGGMMHGMPGVSPAGTAPMPPAAMPGHDEAVAIARKRFASGEITKDQFDELMKALG